MPYYFPGTQRAMALPAITIPDGPFTMVCKHWATDVSGDKVVFGFDDNAGLNRDAIAFRSSSAGGSYGAFSSLAGSAIADEGDIPAITGAWVYQVITYDGVTTMKNYANGAQSGADMVVGDPGQIITASFLIGRHGDGVVVSSNYKGYVADCAIINELWSPAQMAAFAADTPLDQISAMATIEVWYDLDSLVDRTGNYADLTFSDAGYIRWGPPPPPAGAAFDVPAVPTAPLSVDSSIMSTRRVVVAPDGRYWLCGWDATNFYVEYSDNNGVDWIQEAAFAHGETPEGGWNYVLGYDNFSQPIVFTALDTVSVYRRSGTDGAPVWTAQTAPTITRIVSGYRTEMKTAAIFAHPDDDNRFIILSSDQGAGTDSAPCYWLSTDGMATWNRTVIEDGNGGRSGKVGDRGGMIVLSSDTFRNIHFFYTTSPADSHWRHVIITDWDGVPATSTGTIDTQSVNLWDWQLMMAYWSGPDEITLISQRSWNGTPNEMWKVAVTGADSGVVTYPYVHMAARPGTYEDFTSAYLDSGHITVAGRNGSSQAVIWRYQGAGWEETVIALNDGAPLDERTASFIGINAHMDIGLSTDYSLPPQLGPESGWAPVVATSGAGGTRGFFIGKSVSVLGSPPTTLPPTTPAPTTQGAPSVTSLGGRFPRLISPWTVPVGPVDRRRGEVLPPAE